MINSIFESNKRPARLVILKHYFKYCDFYLNTWYSLIILRDEKDELSTSIALICSRFKFWKKFRIRIAHNKGLVWIYSRHSKKFEFRKFSFSLKTCVTKGKCFTQGMSKMYHSGYVYCTWFWIIDAYFC